MADQQRLSIITTNLNTPGTEPKTSTAWERRWEQVPEGWRTGTYIIDQAPYNEVFTYNSNYIPGRAFDFRPAGPERLGQELSWWVYTYWSQGIRKIEPSMLRWWEKAVSSLTAKRHRLGHAATSLLDFAPEEIIQEATSLFYAQNKRFPSISNKANLVSITNHMHLFLSARTTDTNWWDNNVWSLRVDDRIPRRTNEPSISSIVNLKDIEPLWLREGLRFYLSQELIYQNMVWTSLVTRYVSLKTHFGAFLTQEGISSPTLGENKEQIRDFSTNILSWLLVYPRKDGKGTLTRDSVARAQSHINVFYEYMYENKEEAAHATGDPRWLELTYDHMRIWAPDKLIPNKRKRSKVEETYITPEDLSAMAECIKILMVPTTEKVTVYPVGREPIASRGLGDSQAARFWLLQAALGRRASEILMLNYNCLTAIPGAETTDPNAFVARLTYQQTKIDGIDPTILVEQYVVDLINAQRDWLRNRLNLSATDPNPTYLFVNPRQDYKGLHPRVYSSVSRVLQKLNKYTNITDAQGNPLHFTHTHRLRHTRATTLLNAGVPVHVVQDYLGHRSPEMTMHYAKTLAKTAEAEFLKAASTGAFGKPLEMSKQDAYQIAQLEGRMDRILPNGMCMLPPTQSCDKGNACLTCTAFATDSTHLNTLETQRKVTLQLITDRKKLVKEKHGRDMPDDNVWLIARTKEVQSLDSIISALNTANGPVKGAGTCPRQTPAEERTADDA